MDTGALKGKTLHVEWVGDLLCVVTGHRSISDRDIEQFLGSIKSSRRPIIRMLVRSGEGAPNSLQRSQFNELCKDRSIRFAVVTDSFLARGAVTAFSWMGSVQVRAFSPAEWRAAGEYLAIEPDLVARGWETITRVYDAMT